MPVRDYSNTIIYQIKCKDETRPESYVGHTTNMKKRKSHHKTSTICQSSPNYGTRLYQYIRENGGWDNFEIHTLEVQNFASVHEAKDLERHYINQLGASLNMVLPGTYNRRRAQIQREWMDNNGKNVKCECPCGGKYVERFKNVHEGSLKHKRWVEQQGNLCQAINV